MWTYICTKQNNLFTNLDTVWSSTERERWREIETEKERQNRCVCVRVCVRACVRACVRV